MKCPRCLSPVTVAVPEAYRSSSGDARESLAPAPAIKNGGGNITIGVIALLPAFFFGVVLAHGGPIPIVMGLAFGVLALAHLGIGISRTTRNSQIEKGLGTVAADWSRAWLCRQCGAVFEPGGTTLFASANAFRQHIWKLGGYGDLE